MIIAQGSVNIDENAKLAQEAEKNAEKTTDDKVKAVTGKFDSALDGKITQSIYEPGSVEDTNSHAAGDLWIVVTGTGYDATATEMYIYDGSAWQKKTWDAQALSVKTLDALTADLGTVNSGTLNSVFLYAKNLTLDVSSDDNSYDEGHNSKEWSGTVSQGMGVNWNHGLLHLNAQNLSDSCYDATYIGPNDIKVRKTDGYDPGSYLYGRVDIDSTGVVVGNNWSDTKTTHLNADGGVFVGGQLNSNDGIKAGGVNDGWQNNGSICPASGTDIFFHNESDSTMDIHAGDVISHGKTLTSTLSSKRNIADISTVAALAKVNATDIQQWQYKTDDNTHIHIGPIIDDVNQPGNKQFVVPNDLVKTVGGETGFDESNALSMALAAIQELSKRNDNLSQRITKLESEIVNNVK